MRKRWYTEVYLYTELKLYLSWRPRIRTTSARFIYQPSTNARVQEMPDMVRAQIDGTTYLIALEILLRDGYVNIAFSF